MATKLRAADMKPGGWYRTDDLGRFVCQAVLRDGVLIALDGDLDM